MEPNPSIQANPTKKSAQTRLWQARTYHVVFNYSWCCVLEQRLPGRDDWPFFLLAWYGSSNSKVHPPPSILCVFSMSRPTFRAHYRKVDKAGIEKGTAAKTEVVGMDGLMFRTRIRLIDRVRTFVDFSVEFSPDQHITSFPLGSPTTSGGFSSRNQG